MASEYGRGTKFFFTVLVGRASPAMVETFQHQDAEQRASAELANASPSDKTTGRVLVVEDNEFNIEVVRCMLENAGHTVAMAMNGQDGVEAWRRAREHGEAFDAILMDCNMPIMDGYEATRRIRTQLAEEANGQPPQALPIVALTAYAMPGDKDKCLNAGMTDYITKPVNRDVLLSTVLKHMRLHWQRIGDGDIVSGRPAGGGGGALVGASASSAGGGGGGSGVGRHSRPSDAASANGGGGGGGGGGAGGGGGGSSSSFSGGSCSGVGGQSRPSSSRPVERMQPAVGAAAETSTGAAGHLERAGRGEPAAKQARGGRGAQARGGRGERVPNATPAAAGGGSSGSGSSGGGAAAAAAAAANGGGGAAGSGGGGGGSSSGSGGSSGQVGSGSGVPDERPFDRDAARGNYQGPGGDALVSRMEEEFVAKSGALVGRMTVAAAQDNLIELSSELETLQDFSHMLRARGLSEALGSLERVLEDNQTTELKRTLQTVDVAAQRLRSFIIQGSEPDTSSNGVDRAFVDEWVASNKDAFSSPGMASGKRVESRPSSSGTLSSTADTAAAAGGGGSTPGGSRGGSTRSHPVDVTASGADGNVSDGRGVEIWGLGTRGGDPVGPVGLASSVDGQLSFPSDGAGGKAVQNSFDMKAVAGPISAFVQRGEMMLERMQMLCEQGNLKAVRREALKMRETASKLQNEPLVSLAEQLADVANGNDGDKTQAAVGDILQRVQKQLNHIMNSSVRGMLVHNTLTELSEDLRLAAKSDGKTAHIQLAKAASELAQLSEYLSVHHRPSAAPGERQCQVAVASCVGHGREMLEAMAREQQGGHSMHYSAACRLVADTFLAVVADLGQAAESDEIEFVSRRVDRVNARFSHTFDLIARNASGAGNAAAIDDGHRDPRATKGGQRRATFAQALTGDGGGSSPPPNPIIDQALALQQFGGDLTFLRQMCLKFISTRNGVVERIQALVERVHTNPSAASYTDLRREGHSLKGAASTVGAMRLSQTALDLQLAAESEASFAKLSEISSQVLRQFQMVCAAIDPVTGDLIPGNDAKTDAMRDKAGTTLKQGRGASGGAQLVEVPKGSVYGWK